MEVVVKRVVAVVALLLGTAAFAVPASASSVCVHVNVSVNGTTVDKTECA